MEELSLKDRVKTPTTNTRIPISESTEPYSDIDK